MAVGIYIFYISKLYEYFDTYIMLLKGNLNQVSFLHCYHHISISLIWWSIAYSAPGGDAWYVEKALLLFSSPPLCVLPDPSLPLSLSLSEVKRSERRMSEEY